MNNDVFSKYSVPKSVFTMAVPTILSMLVMIFYNMADTFFVGQTHNSSMVAAVSVATPVFTFLLAFASIFGVGGSTFIARALGENNTKQATRISAFCLYGIIAIAILISAFLLIFMPEVLVWIGTDANTVGYAREYVTAISFGTIPIMLSFAYGNIVRSEGAARTSMVGMMVGTVVNIILDPIMILGMKMGVRGAAVATVIGNICATLFYFFYILRGKTVLTLSPKSIRFGDGIMKETFKIGIPASLNNILMSVSNVVMNNCLVAYSTAAVAAMGVAMKANMLVIFVQMGMANGIQPLIGYSYGAKDFTRLKKTVRFTALCNLVLGSLLTALYFFNTESVIRIFLDDKSVITYGILMLRALMLSGPFIGIMFVFTFSLQGMGKGKESFILSAARQGIVFFPVLFIARALIGLNGLIYAQPIADLCCLVMASLMFIRVLRKDAQKGL